MKMYKRIASLLLAGCIAASLLAGCSGQKKDSSASTTTASSQNTEKKTEPVNLKVMLWESAANVNFKNLWPQASKDLSDVKIDVVTAPDKEYPDKLTVALAAGEDIDIFGTKNPFDYSDIAAKNQCMALDDIITKQKTDLKGFGNLVDSLKFNGKILGLPIGRSAWVLYYNKDLFDKAGVAYPKEDMTWTEFTELAKKMTKGEGNDKIWGTFIQTWDAPLNMPGLQRGNSVLVEDASKLKESIQLLANLYKDKSASDWGTNKTTSAHYRAAFEKGNVAMLPMGDFLAASLIQDKKDGKHNVNWDVAVIPHPDGVKAGTTWGNPGVVSIKASSKKADAAFKVLYYISGEKGSMEYAKNGLLPAYITPDINKAYTSLDGMPKNAKIFLEGTVMPESVVSKGAKSVAKVFMEESELFLIGKNSMDTAIQNFEKRRKAELGN